MALNVSIGVLIKKRRRRRWQRMKLTDLWEREDVSPTDNVPDKTFDLVFYWYFYRRRRKFNVRNTRTLDQYLERQ